MGRAAAAAARKPMKWWGWGDPHRRADLPSSVDAELERVLGHRPDVREHVPFDMVQISEPELGSAAKADLERVVGRPAVTQSKVERVEHAAGKSYADLVRMRLGRIEPAPDAVVYPGSEEEVAEVLGVCGRHDLAVVTFGGGTSVVGGVAPLRGGHAAVVSLDLSRLSSVKHIDQHSHLAVFEPGIRGPQAESLLGARGFTLGHFPQSFEYSTVGGWAATRSAGQASGGYGSIRDLVEGVRLVAPAGTLALGPVPHSAAGPDLRELVVGSEGVLGVITEVTARVRPRPERRRYEAWMLESFEEGAHAMRDFAQAGPMPAVARLSDREETRVTILMAGQEGMKRRVTEAYLRARGVPSGCLIILGFEGTEHDVRRDSRSVAAKLKHCGAVRLGRAPGAAWFRGRFEGPYFRDALMDRGMFVETLETATTWTRVEELHRGVRDAIGDALSAFGTPPIVMCHISHLYPTGTSLYFTFMAKQDESDAIEQWRAAKSAASDAIVAHGGTITHHHAIGVDHLPWIEAELGPTGLQVLGAVRDRLDPQGILNPGKLIPRT